MSIHSETIRYLGYKNTPPDGQTESLIEACLHELAATAKTRAVSRRVPLELQGNTIKAAGMTIESADLAKNLQGCTQLVLFAATLGHEVDRRLKGYTRLNISKAAVFQAAAAAVLESYCDDWQAALTASLKSEGLFCRPRFSPGYGDFALSHQSAFLAAVGAGKTLGITLTEGNLMLPEKSVTAVMGIADTPGPQQAKSCTDCSNIICVYKR